MQLTADGPWLDADLGRPRTVLSFAPHRPGRVTAQRISWREVCDDDLTPEFDVDRWLAEQVMRTGRQDCVVMLTSRSLRHVVQARAGMVSCAATVGLGNAERVGHRRATGPGYGTVNLAVLIEDGLSEPALIEALSIATEARTAAIMDAGLVLPSGVATGTGTDCIALTADAGTCRHVGLNTQIGEWLGRVVYQAVLTGAQHWLREQADA